MYNYVIIGAGFAGAVMAERIANELNEKVLVIEKRNHIGGNAFDCFDDQGVLIHQYGPHIFHTRNKDVWDYLSQFTEWYLYHHEVLGVLDGNRVPIPFNLNTLHTVFPPSLAGKLEEKLISSFGYNVKVPILKLRETNDEDLQFLADYIYEKIFLHYTVKQWGVKPEDLDPAVTGRVPVYISRDNRYFQDRYQGMPKKGYTKLFENLLANKNIHVMLNTDYHDVLTFNSENGSTELFGQPFNGKLIYSGKVDELFDYEFGELPYRSLRFEFESLQQNEFQTVGTVNYPNDYDFTRITEFKHLTGQDVANTTIVKEFPQSYEKDVPGKDIPYYPIQNDDNQEKYSLYKNKAKQFDNLILLGRLAEYRYYDMDAVVAMALKVFRDKVNK